MSNIIKYYQLLKTVCEGEDSYYLDILKVLRVRLVYAKDAYSDDGDDIVIKEEIAVAISLLDKIITGDYTENDWHQLFLQLEFNLRGWYG